MHPQFQPIPAVQLVPVLIKNPNTSTSSLGSSGYAPVYGGSTGSYSTSYTGPTSYTYSSASNVGSGGSVFRTDDTGRTMCISAAALYSITTDGPGAAAKKKKRKKRKKKGDKQPISKEEQELERDRAQETLAALAEPDRGAAVDESKAYLLDKGPKQIIVNYLPLELSEEELKALFEQYGPVEAARFVVDKHTGKSKGYGFVYYYYSAHARAAIAGMNGFELYGRYLRVSYAVPQRPHAAASANGEQAPDDSEDSSDDEED